MVKCLSLLLKTNKISTQSSCLFTPIKFTKKSCVPVCSLYVFRWGVFCTPILSNLAENKLLSRYRLKFLARIICSYCKYDAFRRMICASGVPIFATFLFVSNVFSGLFQGLFLFSCLLLLEN